MYPHRIRLRGPWTCEPLFQFIGGLVRSTNNLPPAFRMTMPGRWSAGGLHNFRGGVRFLRRFGYPGRIDACERVWLTLAGLDDLATVTLNDHFLGNMDSKTGPAEFDVTGLLRPRNHLCVDVEAQEPDGGLWGEVALEVRATAFLRDVHFDRQPGRLTASGFVVGEAPRPLELYLFAGDRFLAYSLTEAAVLGQAFTIAGDLEGDSSPGPMRVELIDTATIWYVVEGTV